MEVCIDFGGTEIKVGLVDAGVVVASEARGIQGTAADLEVAATIANRLIVTRGAKVDAVGIAVPGVIDRERGRLLHANDKYDWLTSTDLIAWGTEAFRAPTVLENDARAALMGEVTYGDAAGARDAVMLILGTGIGTAAMMDGVLLRGAHDHAGILGGHVTVEADGPTCPCGNVGCAEALASTWALRESGAGQAGIRELIAAAQADGDAKTTLDRYLHVWGATVVNLCHAYDPEVVILSGGVLRAGVTVSEPIETYVAAHLWRSQPRPRFVVPAAPESSVLRGLAALAAAATKRHDATDHTPSKERYTVANSTIDSIAADPAVQHTYDTQPTIALPAGERILRGADAWEAVRSLAEDRARALRQAQGPVAQGPVVLVDTYPGVDLLALTAQIAAALPGYTIVNVEDAALPIEQIDELIETNLTDDRVFGVLSHLNLDAFYDQDALAEMASAIDAASEPTVIVGWGAALLEPFIHASPVTVLVDMARWELQLRQRAGATNWRIDNPDEDNLRKYKRGFFVEWRVADRHKRALFDTLDFVLDGNAIAPAEPRGHEAGLITGDAFRGALAQAAERPFRVVPFFDPGVWGGQWMKSLIGLDPSKSNYAWCFDCVPEENSLLLEGDGGVMEIPSLDLVLREPVGLLGPKTYSRFGAEFPIRFDFLDTMEGGNLSLQVHPLTDYIQNTFGMHYTQDESYYLLDAEPNAEVFLGTKTGIDPDAMLTDLATATDGAHPFPAEKYINAFPARKHDHFAIPAGTVHCSGADSMVLEISATPFIFTFKLWDWGRLGLDGIPRPVHLEHGARNIQWDRDTEWVNENLIDQVEVIREEPGVIEERTGLHELEFIETRRHWFDERAAHDTEGTVNVLNLVEGDEVRVISPTDAFAPFVIHYAETFIIPASVGRYVIEKTENSRSTRFATIKAYVRGTRDVD